MFDLPAFLLQRPLPSAFLVVAVLPVFDLFYWVQLYRSALSDVLYFRLVVSWIIVMTDGSDVVDCSCTHISGFNAVTVT